jgi:2,3-bisphosphoglycerate-independent phosphoglycerate mutase
MKLIILIPDGMCDYQYEELGNLSPAEYAQTPGMDEMVRRGSIGLMKTMHEGLPLGSLVGILGIFGYNPPHYVPRGRSIFEARALGLKPGPNDLVARCNVVRVNSSGVLEDFTAGQISNEMARAYLDDIRIPSDFEIHHDNSYRNVLICKDCELDDTKLELFEPHENMGYPIEKIMPRYQGEIYGLFADMMHESVRDGLMLWPWGAGRIRDFPPMPYRSITVTGISFLYGMATALGGQAIIPEGATGYLGSNLNAKLKAALENLDNVDVCLIHCNAPDEEAHVHNVAGKVQAIADIDVQVIQPLLSFLETYPQPYRVVLLPDHYTVCKSGKHLPDLIPYVTYGTGIHSNHVLKEYSEVGIINSAPPIMDSHDLIQLHLGE